MAKDGRITIRFDPIVAEAIDDKAHQLRVSVQSVGQELLLEWLVGKRAEDAASRHVSPDPDYEDWKALMAATDDFARAVRTSFNTWRFHPAVREPIGTRTSTDGKNTDAKINPGRSKR